MAETLCGSPYVQEILTICVHAANVLLSRLYMAPEILRYEKYDAKADLWSIGVVLYEMAVGKTPYRANNPQELIKRIEKSKGVAFPDEDPARASEGLVPVPTDIKTLIRSLLKHQPVERSSFDDFFGSTALARSKFPPPGTQSRDESTEIRRSRGEETQVENEAKLPPSKPMFTTRPSERGGIAIPGVPSVSRNSR